MIWITTGTDYGTGDMKRSEVVATEAHKDHPDKVGYSEFNWYFNLDSSGPLLKNTPYTIVENANIKYKITYNTNGGSQIAEGNQTNLLLSGRSRSPSRDQAGTCHFSYRARSHLHAPGTPL